jgi:hypothetical protein
MSTTNVVITSAWSQIVAAGQDFILTAPLAMHQIEVAIAATPEALAASLRPRPRPEGLNAMVELAAAPMPEPEPEPKVQTAVTKPARKTKVVKDA